MKPSACYPGTVVSVTAPNPLTGIFSVTEGIPLSQVCDITGLETGAVQNWIKRGYVNPPVNRKYSKGQLARIILINLLRDTFVIERIAALLSYVNGDLLDRSDDIMDDSEIYQCLCDILIHTDTKDNLEMDNLPVQIEEHLCDFNEPYKGAKERLKLALQAMVYACRSSEYKRMANQLTENAL